MPLAASICREACLAGSLTQIEQCDGGETETQFPRFLEKSRRKRCNYLVCGQNLFENFAGGAAGVVDGPLSRADLAGDLVHALAL